MNETRYLISETAKITQVEPHVLRYWEEELGLAIGRNEMGHRYYTEKDIHTFMSIKELKKKGLQLRAIRTMIQQEDQDMAECGIADRMAAEEIKAEKTQKTEKSEKAEAEHRAGGGAGQQIIKLQEKRREKAGEQRTSRPAVKSEGKSEEKSVKSKEERFGEIMERLIHDIELGERKEGRYRRLDEAIRKHQQSRKMVAATEENVKRKKKRKSKK